VAWTDAAVKDGQICVGKGEKKIGSKAKIGKETPRTAGDGDDDHVF